MFPSGQHSLSLRSNVGAYSGPVIVRGQGMDTTLLRVRGEPETATLVVRDATLDLSSDSIVGRNARLVLLERVRLLGWDTGAGGSTAIDHRRGAVIVVRDGQILDAFGRAPGRGTVAYLHDACSLILERTRVELAGSRLFGYDGALCLLDCVITGLRSDELTEASEKKRRRGTVHIENSTLPIGPRPQLETWNGDC